MPQRVVVDYFGVETNVSLVAQAQTDEYSMDVGAVILTQIGEELSTVCRATPDVNVEFDTTKHWSKLGCQCVRTGLQYRQEREQQ